MKVATWNINSINVRLPHVAEWLSTAKPDVLCVQETKSRDDKFPMDDVKATGYDVIFSGQPAYNGVAILAHEAMTEVVTDIPGLEDPQRRVLGTTIGNLRILNLYVPNGMEVGSDKYAYKLEWLDKLNHYIKQQLKAHEHLLVVGDFNIAPEDRDVYDPKLWAGKVLCSEPERQAFQDLLALGLVDTFRLFDQPEKTYSWWNYRQLAIRFNKGLRIDHILASDALAKHCQSCTVDKVPRKWERPSDHAPVIAEFDLS